MKSHTLIKIVLRFIKLYLDIFVNTLYKCKTARPIEEGFQRLKMAEIYNTTFEITVKDPFCYTTACIVLIFYI